MNLSSADTADRRKDSKTVNKPTNKFYLPKVERTKLVQNGQIKTMSILLIGYQRANWPPML